MYPAKAGSPKTTLAAELSAVATSMTLSDASVLPTAPNLAVLGNDSDAEVVSYTTITGNVVSGLIRGLGGTTASVWAIGTDVARNFTSFDHDRFISNIEELESNKLSSVSWGDIGGDIDDQTDLGTALSAKADLLSPEFTGTPIAPTAAAGTNNTQIATTAFVNTALANEILYFNNVSVTGSISNAEIMRITDDRITTNTVVLECVFNEPNYITTSVSWTSEEAGKMKFVGTTTAGTTARVVLGQNGNL